MKEYYQGLFPMDNMSDLLLYSLLLLLLDCLLFHNHLHHFLFLSQQDLSLSFLLLSLALVDNFFMES